MSKSTTQRISEIAAATPISRILRLVLGVAMVGMVAAPLQRAAWQGRLEVAAVVAGFIVFYLVVHLLVTRYFGWLNPWLGALIAATPVFLVFLGGGIYAAGAILFVGLSLILIAAIGHPGCEVLALPALILGRRTHLACIAFTPIDWVEGKVMEMFRGARS